MQAIKNLRTLIKMHKLYVDEQRRVLAQKTGEAEAIMADITTTQQNLEEEKKKAAESHEGFFSIGAFIENELNNIEQLQEKLFKKEKEVAAEHAKLAGMFEELKRYEIAHEAALDEQMQKENTAEIKNYDEQASQRHFKKTKT